MTAGHAIEELQEGRLVQLGPRSHYVESTPNGAANAGVVVGDAATLLVDTRLTPALGRDLVAAARRLTGGDERPMYFVNTHFHGDHAFGNEACEGMVGIASEWTVRALQSQQTWADQVRFFNGIRPHQREQFEAVRPLAPQVGVTESATIDLGGVTVSLRTQPRAHTSGELIVRVDDERVVYVADLIFNGHWPVLWDGDLGGWRSALEQLRALENYTIVPGHGPAGGPELIDRMRDCWRFLTDLAAGTEDADELSAAAAASPYASWLHPVRVKAAVDELRGAVRVSR